MNLLSAEIRKWYKRQERVDPIMWDYLLRCMETMETLEADLKQYKEMAQELALTTLYMGDDAIGWYEKAMLYRETMAEVGDRNKVLNEVHSGNVEVFDDTYSASDMGQHYCSWRTLAEGLRDRSKSVVERVQRNEALRDSEDDPGEDSQNP